MTEPVALRSFLRQSAPLLVARAVQAAAGVALLLLLVRTIKPSGYGNVLTVTAVGAVVGTVLAAALSDAFVVYGQLLSSAIIRGLFALVAVAGIAEVVAMGPRWIGVTSAPLLFTALSIATSGRHGAARVNGEGVKLAVATTMGPIAGLFAVVALAILGIEDWAPYTLSFALQPLPLMFLSRPVGAPSSVRPAGLLAFIVPAVSTQVLGQGTILILRAMTDAHTVGLYGGMMRILDLLAILGPLMATFALPQLVRSYETGRSQEGDRINFAVAVLGSILLTSVLPATSWVWSLLMVGQKLPIGAYVLLAAAAGISVAAGLPDRMLQSRGRPRSVARAIVTTAVCGLLLTAAMTPVMGLLGVGVSRVVATGVLYTWLMAGVASSLAKHHLFLALLCVTAAVGSSLTGESVGIAVVGSALGLAAVAVVGWLGLRHASLATPRQPG